MKKAKILLIDDDELFLSLTEKTLRDSYLKTIKCKTHAREAREYLDSCREKGHRFPDIIFLDIDMPGIGGLEFAELYSRRYAKEFPDTKLVILTSSISRKDKEKALEISGINGFIEKPLTQEKLNELIPQ